MEKQKIKKRDEKRIVYYVYCPECNQEIKGTKQSQVQYNLKLHLEKHKRK